MREYVRRILGWTPDEELQQGEDVTTEWEEPTATTSLKNSIKEYWYMISAFILFVGGWFLYWYQNSPISGNSTFLGVSFLAASYIIVYIYGRHKGFETVKELDLLVYYMNDKAAVYVGKKESAFNGVPVFHQLNKISYGGMKKSFDKFKNSFSRNIRSQENKIGRVEKDGSGKTNTEIDNTAVITESNPDIFDNVFVGHASEITEDLRNPYVDFSTKTPDLIPAEESTKIKRTLEQYQRQVESLERKNEQLEEEIEEAFKGREKIEEKTKENILEIIETQRSIMQQQKETTDINLGDNNGDE